MPTPSQLQTLTNVISLIRSAEQALVQAGRASTDPVEWGRLNMEYNQLDSFLSQLMHAQATDDDNGFASAVAALNQQASILQSQEAEIKAIVTDVGLAAQVVGYIAQAAVFIATV